MKRYLRLLYAVCAFTLTATAKEPAQAELRIGSYSFSLPKEWKKTDEKTQRMGVYAKRMKMVEEKEIPVGEIMAAELRKPLAKESAEMEASAKKNPGMAKLLEAKDFKLENGLQGRKVLLLFAMRDHTFGSPIIFYSVYLPEPDGSCITIKLRCGAAEFENLRKEFDGIISKAEQEKNSVRKAR